MYLVCLGKNLNLAGGFNQCFALLGEDSHVDYFSIALKPPPRTSTVVIFCFWHVFHSKIAKTAVNGRIIIWLSIPWSFPLVFEIGKRGNLSRLFGFSENMDTKTKRRAMTMWLVSNMSLCSNVQPYLKKWSNLTHIFQMGRFNHQLDDFGKDRFWSSSGWQKFTTNDVEASRVTWIRGEQPKKRLFAVYRGWKTIPSYIGIF